MSRDFNKEDFQKGAEKDICSHCGTEEGTFTLIKLYIEGINTHRYTGLYTNISIM